MENEIKSKEALPGSSGEHALQAEMGSEKCARAFYEKLMLDYLNAEMQEFISSQTMMFIASSDARGECDCSFRAGSSGFVSVLDRRHLLWPEYRGNGVMASGGNARENPHMGLLFIDFTKHTIGLHVNGKVRLRKTEQFNDMPDRAREIVKNGVQSEIGKKPEFWFLLEVEEAYMHCAKHIPRLMPGNKSIDWGTDDIKKKGGDFFHVKQAKGQGYETL